MEKLQVQNTITINATAAKVWDALVNPEQTKKYMFGCETVSDWQPGSALLWRMEYEGQTILTVTQGDYNTVAEGERRYQEAYNNGEGWNPIMVQIKEVAEQN